MMLWTALSELHRREQDARGTGADATRTAPALAVEDWREGARAGDPPEVRQFLQFAAEQRDRLRTEPAHLVAADGIRRLAGAVATLAEQRDLGDSTLARDVTRLDALADTLERDPVSWQRSRHARVAFVAAGELLVEVQARADGRVAPEAIAARRAAARIMTADLLLRQRRAVARFFDRVTIVVRALAEGPAAAAVL